MHRHGRTLVSLAAIVFVWSTAAFAQAPPALGPSPALPPVNLGLTSFFDGAPPAGPGLYAQEYLQYYSARLIGPDGKHVPGLPDLSLFTSLTQFIYMSDQPVFFGGQWGANAIVPFVSPHLDHVQPGFSSSDAGLGDIVFGPFVQWGPVSFARPGGPLLFHRFDLDMSFPTGEYDDDAVINPGSNFFSLNPYWAATLFLPEDNLELSVRAHYLWNAENHDPSKELFPDAETTRAGQAFHINFAASYFLVPKKLSVGVAGYYLKQLTDSEVDGHNVPNSRSQIFGIGPGLLWKPTENTFLIANAYFESQAESFTEGTRYVVRFGIHF